MAIVSLTALCAAGTALADGDPASDVLVSDPLFLPWDAGVSTASAARLTGTVESASAHGFPIRVALIASQSDLGTVTSLWGEPADYASYLGTELSLDYHGDVLVAMPDGFGLYSDNRLPPAVRADVEGLRPPGQGGVRLLTGALDAVRSLASAGGHPIEGVPASVSTPPPVAAGGGATTSWIVFAAGAVLIGLAWGASLAARPLRPRGGAS